MILFWFGVFEKQMLDGPWRIFACLSLHGGTFLLLSIDFAISNTTLCRSHIVFPVTMLSVYMAFNAFLALALDNLVYPVLDWKSTSSHVFVAAAIIVQAFAFWAFSKLRRKPKRPDMSRRDFMALDV